MSLQTWYPEMDYPLVSKEGWSCTVIVDEVDEMYVGLGGASGTPAISKKSNELHSPNPI
jgi:hypothetical protein